MRFPSQNNKNKGRIMAKEIEEDLIIRDPQKAAEIAEALKQPRDKTIKPSEPPSLPKDANEIWFPHGKGKRKTEAEDGKI